MSWNGQNNVRISQNVVPSVLNSTSVPLAGGATFTGTGEPSTDVAGLQINIKSDRNCYVYLDQSIDNINWDFTDRYKYYAAKGGKKLTAQATAAYWRLRITNIESAAMTILRAQAVMCPAVEAVPSSLTEDLRFMSESTLIDGYGNGIEATAMGELRTATPVKLVGSTFNGTTIDDNFWNATNVLNGATITQGDGRISLRTNGAANASAMLFTRLKARYVAGSQHRFRGAGIQVPDLGIAGNSRDWGVADATALPTIQNGAWFRLNGTSMSVVTMKAGAPTVVPNGSFNGDLGSTYQINTDAENYEIYWTNGKVLFVIDDEVLHEVDASVDTWTESINFYVYCSNVNAGGLASDRYLYARALSIHRLGELNCQPRSFYQNGLIGAKILKYGPGNLHGIFIGQATTGAIIELHDALTATNAIMSCVIVYPGGGNFNPAPIDLYGAPFSTGLVLAITVAAARATVFYE